MRCSLPFAATLAPALLLAATAAADITADQFWSAWQAGAGRSGQTIAAREVSRGDGALRLDGVSLTASQAGASTRTELDWVLVEELADGRVRASFAPELRVAGRFTDADGRPGVLEATLRMTGAELVASGSPETLVQRFSAGRIELERFAVAGPEGVAAEAGATGHVADVATRYESAMQAADRLAVTGDATAREARLSLWAENPGDATRLDVDIVFERLAWRFDNLLAPAEAGTHPLRAGTRVGLDADFGAVRSRIGLDSADPARRMRAETQGGAGKIAVGVDGEELRYAGKVEAVRYVVAAPGLPFEALTAEIGAAEIDLRLPLGPVGGSGGFSLDYRLRDVSPGPEVWMLLDATGGLDRTPAQVDLALSGRLRLPGDMLAQPLPGISRGAALPAELAALSIDRLALSAVGARVRGEGALDFPAEAPAMAPRMAPGMRTPEGSIRFELTGADALLERLGTLGIVPANQVMGLRMMLAMFTIPGPSPDSMIVDVEFTPEGRILANGEPLN